MTDPSRLTPKHDRYAFGELLGSGGQGAVYRVVDREAKERALVAKVFAKEQATAMRSEFALLARLSIDGLARGHDFVQGDPSFLVEDFIEGQDACSWVRTQPDQNHAVVSILVSATRTLGALHEVGLVHGDLKPDHVRMSAAGKATILDLGATRGGQESASALTVAFAAPEVIAGGNVTPRSDWYSLGAVVQACVADLRSLAPAVSDLVEELLSQHPGDRPATAADILARLGAAGVAVTAWTSESLVSSQRHVLAALGREWVGNVAYLAGPSGVGKSHLARELVARRLLAGQAVRFLQSIDESQLRLLIQYLRGDDEAWPFSSLPAEALLVVEELGIEELDRAVDGYGCEPRRPKRANIVALRRAIPAGAFGLSMGPFGETDWDVLCDRLGVADPDHRRWRAAGGIPAWLVAERAGTPLGRDAVLGRLGDLPPHAVDLLAALAVAGGALPRTVCGQLLGHRLSSAEDALSSLVERRGFEEPSLSLIAREIVNDLAVALGTFDVVERLGAALLATENVMATVMFRTATVAAIPSCRNALLLAAANKARAGGLTLVEIDAWLAMLADRNERTVDRLRRLERLCRDSGRAHFAPQVIDWIAACDDNREASLLVARRRAEHAARTGKFDDAHALLSAVNATDARSLALLASTRGAVALYGGDWKRAHTELSYAQQALEQDEDQEELAKVEHNLGAVCLYRGDNERARMAFAHAAHIKRILGDQSGVRSSMLNLGHALSKLRRYDEAERALEEATKLAMTLEQKAGLGWCLAAVADLALRQHKIEVADRAVRQAYAVGDSLAQTVRADLAILSGSIALARGEARLALDIVSKIDADWRVADAYTDARALLVTARAHLASLPSRQEAAVELATRARDRAGSEDLSELASEAVALIEEIEHGPVEPARGLPMNGDDSESSASEPAWTLLETIARGAPLDDCLIDLAKGILTACKAERVLVGAASGAVVDYAVGVDLDGLPLSDAALRMDGTLLSTIGREPSYQRAIETPAGLGSRLLVACEGAFVCVEHRFRSAAFDHVAAATAKRWATLARVIDRLKGSRNVAAPLGDVGQLEDNITSTVVPSRAPARQYPTIIGGSTPLRAALLKLEGAIDCDLPVLITGETGVGKEVFARALHEHGRRARAMFVAVNCAAIADSLFEAELFGHAKGSFTGAERTRTGLFARAEGGTLLLDEIGELPLVRQATLLRVLETRMYRPVGSDEERSFNVRVVAATNVDLDDAVKKGTFRSDLLYRLRVLQIAIPSLRDRRDDIPALLANALRRAGASLEIASDALATMMAYDWPGNVRELDHCAQRLATMGSARVERAQLPREMRRSGRVALSVAPLQDERSIVERALEAAQGNISHTAIALGLTRHGLKKKMLRLGLRAKAESRQ